MSENSSKKNVKNVSIFPKISKLLKYTLVSYVISIMLIVALSAVICYTGVPESLSVPGVKVITFIGVFISGFLCARSSNSRGFVTGAIGGIVNIAVLIFISFIFADSSPDFASSLIQIIGGMVFGAVGGIFGINSVKN